MSAPTEAETVAAEFPTITLLDGSPLTLSGSMANTRVVEQRFGSIGGMLGVFNPMAEAVESDDPNAILGQKFMTPVIDLLACFAPKGLRDPDELAEHLDGRRLGEYMTALGEVIRLAFPAGPAGEATVDGPGNDGSVAAIPRPPLADPDGALRRTATMLLGPPDPTVNGSPGVLSGTPPPSPSVAPTPSSGG